jgi:enolase
MKSYPKITKISGMEILDSRGNPTIRVFCSAASAKRAPMPS